MSGAFDQILGGAAYAERAALHGIGPGSFRPARHAAGDSVTELKQGSTQPAGHSFEATASMCWLHINAVVPNDTKVVWFFFVDLNPSVEGHDHPHASLN